MDHAGQTTCLVTEEERPPLTYLIPHLYIGQVHPPVMLETWLQESACQKLFDQLS